MFLTRTKLKYNLKKKCVENGYVNPLKWPDFRSTFSFDNKER